MAEREGRRRRSGGRTREAGGAKSSAVTQLPWRPIRNPFPPFKFVSDDQVEALHRASMQVLKEMGINFLWEPARATLKAAGADVDADSTRVRFDPDLIEDLVAKAPASFTIHARNPEHDVFMGENAINVCMVASPPHVSALDMPRKAGDFQSYTDLLRLAQSLNICHVAAGYPVEPIDLPPTTRHLQAVQAMLTLTDKVAYAYCLGDERIKDAHAMLRIARGVSEDEFRRQPSMTSVVNANSPRQYDIPMLQGMTEMALQNQPVIVTPFTLAGAMAPVTVAGALVQQNAEALAGIAYMQAVNPGAPAIYGGFTSNVDMKTGSPAFGTPEHAKATIVGGQLARRYNLPYRASNVNASNAPDVQSAYEAEMTIWSCFLGHCNMMKHALGWIEGGLCTSFEKVIIDAEMVQMMSEFLKPLDTSEPELALDAIRDVQPGGHYFGTQHTIERYETAFYTPMLSDWRNFETWRDDGSKDATLRAHEIWKQLLKEYEPPALDPAIAEELDAFVRKRTEEGGVGDL